MIFLEPECDIHLKMHWSEFVRTSNLVASGMSPQMFDAMPFQLLDESIKMNS